MCLPLANPPDQLLITCVVTKEAFPCSGSLLKNKSSTLLLVCQIIAGFKGASVILKSEELVTQNSFFWRVTETWRTNSNSWRRPKFSCMAFRALEESSELPKSLIYKEKWGIIHHLLVCTSNIYIYITLTENLWLLLADDRCPLLSNNQGLLQCTNH